MHAYMHKCDPCKISRCCAQIWYLITSKIDKFIHKAVCVWVGRARKTAEPISRLNKLFGKQSHEIQTSLNVNQLDYLSFRADSNARSFMTLNKIIHTCMSSLISSYIHRVLYISSYIHRVLYIWSLIDTQEHTYHP